MSKPIRPPWTDSSKNLVRDLVRWCDHTRFTLMGDRDFQPAWEGVSWRPVYGAEGAYAPSLRQNGRVFLDLVKPDFRHQIDHFFFAPNPSSCRALRTLKRLRRKPVVHTICSVPRTFDGIEEILAADVHIALSRWTADRLEDEGVPLVRYIPPGIDPNLVVPDPDSTLAVDLDVVDRPVVLFAGDYEVGGGAELLIDSWPGVLDAEPEACLVLACRPKTDEAGEREAEVRRRVEGEGLTRSVRFLGQIGNMPDLLHLSTVVAMPVGSTYRKMDIPLVLLEAMVLSKPLVVSDANPVRETLSHGGGLEVPRSDSTALAEALVQILTDQDLRRTLGTQAREAVEQNWHISYVALKYEALYEELQSGPA